MNETVVREEAVVEPRVSALVMMSTRELLRVVICGIAVALLIALMYFVLNKFVFGAVLCRADSSANCQSAPTYAAVLAMIIGAIAGVAALVRLRVYRPLLVVLATVVTFWGMHVALAQVTWYVALIMFVLLFGISYGVFAWVARIRSFLLALVVTVVIVVIARLVLAA